jgi:hypothetical protein
MLVLENPFKLGQKRVLSQKAHLKICVKTRPTWFSDPSSALLSPIEMHVI